MSERERATSGWRYQDILAPLSGVQGAECPLPGGCALRAYPRLISFHPLRGEGACFASLNLI